jgi:ubiquinone/menaquinone biosynthesis C-methylase UbiE
MFFMEIIITWIAMRAVGRSVYEKFANKLGLKGGETVLDFGCGLGTVAHYTVQLIPAGKLVCADISTQRLEQCKKQLRKFGNVEYKNFLTDKTPFPDGTFDVIYCHYVLHELTQEQLTTTLQQMYLWMKESGKLFFREPVGDGSLHRYLDNTLPATGFKKESSTITDIPIMGNAMEGSYSKETGLVAGYGEGKHS